MEAKWMSQAQSDLVSLQKSMIQTLFLGKMRLHQTCDSIWSTLRIRWTSALKALFWLVNILRLTESCKRLVIISVNRRVSKTCRCNKVIHADLVSESVERPWSKSKTRWAQLLDWCRQRGVKIWRFSCWIRTNLRQRDAIMTSDRDNRGSTNKITKWAAEKWMSRHIGRCLKLMPLVKANLMMALGVVAWARWAGTQEASKASKTTLPCLIWCTRPRTGQSQTSQKELRLFQTFLTS